jgi:hypothetical protein
MSYRFHYVFFGAPSECTEEQQAFLDVMAEFNKEQAMPRGLLFCALTLMPNVYDKRAFQGAIFANLDMSRHFVLVLEDSWGPPARDFEKDWAYAQRCIANPELPMREAVILFKSPLLPHKVDPAIVELKQNLLSSGGPHATFDNVNEFRARLSALLSGWLATVE